LSEISNFFEQNNALNVALEPEESKPLEKPARLTYEDFNFDKLNVYAGLDCIATSGLLSRLFPTLCQEETLHYQDDGVKKSCVAPAIIESVNLIEMPSFEFILDLEINGIGYSERHNKWYNDRMGAEVAEFDEKIFSAIGKKINLDSGPIVAEFLYNEKGFEPPFLTKGGEPATDGVAMMTLAGLDPMKGKYVAPDPAKQFLADMAKRRDINSTRNTFIKTYYKDWVKRDGRIHASYNLHGTSSFRITGSDPNLTQLPRPKHGYNVRDCFREDYTVSDDGVISGYVFLTFDFSSAEVKILANMAKEPAMLRAIQDGLDFHTFSASSMFGIPYDVMRAVLDNEDHHLHKDYKSRRQLSKILTFSI